MTIKEKRDAKSLVVEISGRVDSVTAPELSEYLKDAIQGVEDLTLNFKDVDYVSSAGLRVMLYAQKTMNAQGGTLVLTNVNDDIKDTLELTGLLGILTIK